jgi:chromosome partitioning protein
MKIIAIANQKGGVAKTTTATAMGFGLASRGRKTLLIDLDPQGSLTGFLNVDTMNRPTVLEFLGIQQKHTATFKEVVVAVGENLDLLPADISLEEAVSLLLGKPGAPAYLSKALKGIQKLYDYCIIDTSPSLSVITGNAFVAAESIIIPIKPEEASIKGVELLLASVEDVKILNPGITVAGILITMYDKRRKSTATTLIKIEDIASEHLIHIYQARIRASASGAAIRSNPFIVPNLPIAQDYDEFIREFLDAEIYSAPLII